MNGLSSRQIEAAVKWWGERLKRPTFSTLSDEERRDPGSQGAAFAEMLATVYSKPQEADVVLAFKTALRRKLEGKSELVERMGLFVDYGPCRTLSEVLEEAGIEVSMMVLPWKSGMVFPRGGVKAHVGYGTPFEEILEEDDS
jgi:hypothetical protein